MNSEITFLTKEQIFGDDKLNILEKYGTACAITDFSILLGGYVDDNYYTKEGNTGRDRAGIWWTKTQNKGDNDDQNLMYCVDIAGKKMHLVLFTAIAEHFQLYLTHQSHQ